jgi:hypothetical protein
VSAFFKRCHLDNRSLIETLKQSWLSAKRYEPPLIGCTAEEIQQMCSSQQVSQLPDLYIEFMMNFGQNAGGLKNGGDFLFPQVLDFKNRWRPMLPSEDCFVFMTNNDSFALFFQTNGENDPIVYKIDEADNEAALVIEPYGLLLDFFEDWIHEEIEIDRE